jgi:hypothetical protein
MLQELPGEPSGDPEMHDPALAKIVGARRRLVNALPPLRQARSWQRRRSTNCWAKSGEAKHQLEAKLQHRR